MTWSPRTTRPRLRGSLLALALALSGLVACAHSRGASPTPGEASLAAATPAEGARACVDADAGAPGCAAGDAESDGDGDGVADSVDACPTTPGIADDGCPPLDGDGDGIVDAEDKCVHEPETRNGYEDEDGCPDEIPEMVSHFTGAIRGASFGGGGAVGWRPGAGAPKAPSSGAPNREAYAHNPDNQFVAVADDPLSTFAADVDTASYSNVRRFLASGRLPPIDAVRVEEMINYFDYAYPAPTGDERFAVATEVTTCPWNSSHHLVRIGVKGKVIAPAAIPPRNLVFLIDVSGSMASADKLPLLRRGLARLVDTLRAEDRVAIVVYAGAAGVVLPPTSGADKATIHAALGRLEAGGSTAGGAGIELAYKLAQRSFRRGAVNRVILASDGDFNVGPSSVGELTRLIEEKRRSGVFLTTLGFGTGNYSDAMMEQLADKGDGNYAYIDSFAEAEKVLVRESSSTLVTIARDVKLQVEFNPARVKGYRQIGYENRQLADQDFDDDRKDAGELGAGHTVTALYEVIPVDAPTEVKAKSGERRYQRPAKAKAAHGDELMFVKVRSKPAEGGASEVRTHVVAGAPTPLPRASADLRFAVAVAELGMVLRGTAGGDALAAIEDLAAGAIGADPSGDRRGFLELVRSVAAMRSQIDARHKVATSPAAATSVLARVGERYPEWLRSRRVKEASVLPASALPVIDQAAELFAQFPQIRVEISGHTDSREGSGEGEREAIALARAEVVRAYLIDARGIDPAQLTTRTAGSMEPIADNRTEKGRAMNRRTEFTILRQ
ncbi:MAG: von Willebrand factor type A domain-containing protein [Myxococcales bacterium]|nr:von Willebrand factor type A domain-containing protein [Myxococcales bacterium]